MTAWLWIYIAGALLTAFVWWRTYPWVAWSPKRDKIIGTAIVALVWPFTWFTAFVWFIARLANE